MRRKHGTQAQYDSEYGGKVVRIKHPILIPENRKEGRDIHADWFTERMSYAAKRRQREDEYARIRREGSVTGQISMALERLWENIRGKFTAGRHD